MVQTGARASRLTGLLSQAGHSADIVKPRAPRLEDFADDVVLKLLSLYRTLGGIKDAPRLRPGSWDLSFDGVLVELDEELHFNRYRRQTLEAGLGAATPWARFYLDASDLHEGDCLRAGRWGARWTNHATVGMFGEAAEPGDLHSPGGAPRWKQRALYDAMKDAAGIVFSEVRVARLSVWDDVAGVRLGDALEGRATIDIKALSQHLVQRTI